nr:xanthine dehydrogenase [Raoultella sp. NCTC 9187]
MAKYLALPQSRVNVKRSILGGSFGGKDDIIDNIACRAALLAHLTSRPVKISYNRETVDAGEL